MYYIGACRFRSGLTSFVNLSKRLCAAPVEVHCSKPVLHQTTITTTPPTLRRPMVRYSQGHRSWGLGGSWPWIYVGGGQSMFCPSPKMSHSFIQKLSSDNSKSFTSSRTKDLCQKWKLKLIFRGAYRLSGTGIVECLEITDVGCNLKQFDGVTWLTLTPIFYDRSTPVSIEFSLDWAGFSCPPWVTRHVCLWGLCGWRLTLMLTTLTLT